MTLQGQTIVVMGGSSGIGLATAQKAAQAGANVVITGRDGARLTAALTQLPAGSRGESVDATDADDLRELPAFEAYTQLIANGAVQPWCSMQTSPPPQPQSDPGGVRRRSRERFGIEREVVDAELERLLHGAAVTADDVAPRRRTDRGAR